MADFDLKKFRRDFKLKQSDLQDILGITQGFISRVETGKEALPAIHYRTLCEKFGEAAVDKYLVNFEKDSNKLSHSIDNDGYPKLDEPINESEILKFTNERLTEFGTFLKELANDRKEQNDMINHFINENNELKYKLDELRSEINRLKELLNKHGIDYKRAV